jgi:DNA-directed RNA polymerase specialized sigma24 family protein
MPITATSYTPISTIRSVDVAELLPRISQGDPIAWEEILRRYGSLVTATVRSFRLQHADAVDAIQTTWLRLAEHPSDTQPRTTDRVASNHRPS